MKFSGYELQQLLDKLDISEVIGFSIRYKDSDGVYHYAQTRME